MDDYRNEPTAWEDLGPTRQVQASSTSWNAADREATPTEIDLELLGCLTLCVPAGMDRQSRIEWVEVARATVRHLPLDLLRAGCEEARKQADHPAKIVPAILRAAEPLLRMRRQTDMYRVPPERQIEPHYVKPEAAADILAKVAPSFAGIGAKVERPHRPPPRMPTEADYRAMGVTAQGIEARSDETRSGSAEGESPVPQGCAQTEARP